MVGSGEGAGRMRTTTGVVGCCQNTGRWIGMGETKLNEGQGMINCSTRYMQKVYKVQHMRRLHDTYSCGMRLCATAGVGKVAAQDAVLSE